MVLWHHGWSSDELVQVDSSMNIVSSTQDTPS